RWTASSPPATSCAAPRWWSGPSVTAAMLRNRCTATSRPARHRPRWQPSESRGKDSTMTEQGPPGHRHSAAALSGEEFVAAWKRNAAKLSSQGLYDPADEHDACGVGLVASLDGTPRRDVVVAGIEALKAVWHRG